MEADSPPARLSTGCEDNNPADDSIHAFNSFGNITVIEKNCEGSDSGVEAGDNCTYQRALSSNSQDANQGQSCDSSIISCCSNYDEAYNILVRRNSTLLEDYDLHKIGNNHCDGVSENGSESSSVTSRGSKRNNSQPKKNVKLQETNTCKRDSTRPRSKPPITPRLKSLDRLQQTKSSNNKPRTLELNRNKSCTSNTVSSAPSSSSSKQILTPTDDGRWPSINSKPAPLMSRSLRGIVEMTPKTSKIETKSIEKYATLPRRKKEKIDESKREESINRLSLPKKPPSRSLMLNSLAKTKKQKVKIYQETAIQTVLTDSDLEKALAGSNVTILRPDDVEKCDKSVQIDVAAKDLENLKAELRELKEKHESLKGDYKKQTRKLRETEDKLKAESVEKEGLKEELKNNSQRVLTILGEGNIDNASSDSLMVLESRFQNVSQIVIRQEEEISRLNSFCRSLQIDLEKALAAQHTLEQQHRDLENESSELQEFMQAEKCTISEALKEAESEIARYKQQLENKNDENKRLIKLNEQRWQENLSLQARMGALEAKCRELLVQQGSSVSGTAVALSALIGRLEGLVDELVTAYSISEQELDDVIFHNEAYSNSSSSPDATPEKPSKFFTDKPSSPKKGSNFVSAVINAIKNAAAQTPFAHKELSRDNIPTDASSPNELLDSETEPCLMMEPVLEDVIIPDGHSHNMISSCHSLLTQSDSFKEISRGPHSNSMPSLCEIFPSFSLVDQVIDVDNLVTRLLKVIRIIQLETDDCMNELQEQRDNLSEKVDKQKESSKLVTKQLKDWEILGARLKGEVKELMQQISRKNNEIDNIKSELNNQRQQVEKLNQDVCELSTALSKAEWEMKQKDEEIIEAVKNWEKNNEIPTNDTLGRLIASHNQLPQLREQLAERERRLVQLTQEFLESRDVLTENLKQAINEAKKQYEAIDNTLEVLHSNQNLVQQCPQLAELQRDLEALSFQSASAMPLAPADCNANAALLQAALATLSITSPINTTA